MHECPWCGMVCDCDGEDTWLNAPMDCQCDCGGPDGPDYSDGDEWGGEEDDGSL